MKRKGLFPIQPKPPQGFKDYLMNRCTYTLSGNTVCRLKRRNADPPDSIPEGLRELYQEQETERYRMRMQVSRVSIIILEVITKICFIRILFLFRPAHS